jgi:hypothetical protein
VGDAVWRKGRRIKDPEARSGCAVNWRTLKVDLNQQPCRDVGSVSCSCMCLCCLAVDAPCYVSAALDLAPSFGY